MLLKIALCGLKTIFWFAKIAVWPLKFYPFWPCRIRQVMSSQDQEMRNGEFLLRGILPQWRPDLSLLSSKTTRVWLIVMGHPFLLDISATKRVHIYTYHTYTHIHMLYIYICVCVCVRVCVYAHMLYIYMYAHILMKNPCHNFPPPLAFDPQALGHGLEEVPHAPALRRPRVVLRDGAAHGDHTSVVQHVQHGFLGTAQQERHRDAKMRMDNDGYACRRLCRYYTYIISYIYNIYIYTYYDFICVLAMESKAVPFCFLHF